MAKRRFNKKAFKAANENYEDGSGFAEIDDGLYVATLAESVLDESQNGRYQAKFVWKISDEDEEFAGKKFYDCVGLEIDGEVAEENYGFLIQRLKGLRVNAEWLSEFEDEPEKKIKTLTGTVAKIRLKTNEKGFQNKFTQKVLESPLFDEDDEDGDELDSELEDEEEETDSETEDEDEDEDEDEEFELEVGTECTIELDDGQYMAKVISYDEETGDVAFKTAKGKMVVLNVADGKIFPQTDLEDVEEEEEEIELAQNMMVQAIFKGEKVVGQLKELDEKTHKGTIKVTSKGELKGKTIRVKVDVIKPKF